MNTLDDGSGFYFSNAKKRVLAVSGDPRFLAELKMHLKSFFDIGLAADAAAAVHALKARGADAVVIHIGADCDTAFNAYKEIVQHTGGNAPILFLAENDGEALESEALKLGASDFALRRRNGCDALIARIRLRIAERKSVQPGPALAGKVVLVAEDAELNREIIAAMLGEIAGLTVNFAGDGQSAVETFVQNPGGYDMILMDVQMPVMDGLSAAMAIRSAGLERCETIPIIALSATAGQGELLACAEAGMNGFLLKPMDLNEFLDVCARYMR